MKIALFGGTGKTGKHLMQQALDQGHSLRVLVRSPEKVTITHDNLKILQGDMAHPDDLEKVIQGCDAVLSAAGPVKGHDSSFLVGAVRNITSIMKKNGISRIVWLTGAGVMDTRDEKDFMRPLIRGLMKLTAGSVLKASEEAYGALIQSDLDYTVVRAPVLSDSPSNKPLLAGYKPPKPSPIGRDSLAGFMLRCLSDGLWLRESPMIGL